MEIQEQISLIHNLRCFNGDLMLDDQLLKTTKGQIDLPPIRIGGAPVCPVCLGGRGYFLVVNNFYLLPVSALSIIDH